MTHGAPRPTRGGAPCDFRIKEKPIMKQLVVGLMVVATAVVIAAPIAAQTGSSVQIFVGPNISKQTATGATNSEFKTNFLVGGAFTYRAMRSLSLSLSVDYTKAGSGDTSTTFVATELTYITPQLSIIGVLPIENSNIMPWLLAGISYGITVDCKVGQFGTFPQGGDCKDSVKNDLGANFGAGLSFGAIFVGGQYRFSLGAIDDITGTDINLKNQQIQIWAGYSFRFYGNN